MKLILTIIFGLTTLLGFGQTTIAFNGFEQNASDTWDAAFSTPPCTSGSDRRKG